MSREELNAIRIWCDDHLASTIDPFRRATIVRLRDAVEIVRACAEHPHEQALQQRAVMLLRYGRVGYDS